MLRFRTEPARLESDMRRTWTFPAAAAASLVLTQAASLPAAADDSGFFFGPAAFLQFTFGQRWDIGLGIEVRGTWQFEDYGCTWHTSQKGLGAFAQVIVLFRDPRYQLTAVADMTDPNQAGCN